MLDVRVHPALLRTLDDERAAELRHLLRELEQIPSLAPARAEAHGLVFEIAHPPNDTLLFRLRNDNGVAAEAALPEAEIASHLDAWTSAVRQLLAVDPKAPPHGWRALDYARRTVHDEAAAYLAESLASLVTLDLRAARTLFTVLFLLLRDDPLPGQHLA